jgi:hypothetical protein
MGNGREGKKVKGKKRKGRWEGKGGNNPAGSMSLGNEFESRLKMFAPLPCISLCCIGYTVILA